MQVDKKNQTRKTVNNLENKITRAYCHNLIMEINTKKKKDKHTMFLNLGAKE
jgi:hypothetical protein